MSSAEFLLPSLQSIKTSCIFRYFSLQAAEPLGFPDSVRYEIEGNICREEGPLSDCFAKPRAIILRTIEKVRQNDTFRITF